LAKARVRVRRTGTEQLLNISRLTFLVTDLPPPEGSASLYDLDTGALSDALRQAFSDAGIGL